MIVVVVLKSALTANGTYTTSELVELIKSRGISQKPNGALGSFITKLDKDEITRNEMEAITSSLDGRTKDLLKRLVNDDLAVWNWPEFTRDVTAMYNNVSENGSFKKHDEHNATYTFTDGKKQDCSIPNYIPQLARVDKDSFALSICTVDGQRFHIGDYTKWYTMQSTSKPFFYSIAHALIGDQLHEYVGHEPSGRAFNEICLDNYNRPFNPMINMGAIMVTSLIKPDMILADRFDFIRNIMKEFSGGRHVFCDMARVVRNFALKMITDIEHVSSSRFGHLQVRNGGWLSQQSSNQLHDGCRMLQKYDNGRYRVDGSARFVLSAL